MAVSVSRGEFIRFLDSDDLLPAGINDTQCDIARHENADVVVAGYTVVNEVDGSTREVPWTDCDDFVAQQLGECDSSHYSAYLFRRAFIEGVPHRQEFGFRDDRMFVIEMALRSPKVARCDRSCLVHRHHAQERLQFQGGIASVVTNRMHFALYGKAVAMLEARAELTPRRRRAVSRILWPLAHWTAYSHLEGACEVVDFIDRLDPEFVAPNPGVLGWLYRSVGFRKTETVLQARRLILRLFNRSVMRLMAPISRVLIPRNAENAGAQHG